MDSPVSLLRFAVNENDVQHRTNQVVKACKIITDILPFDRKNHVLVEEPELMKYLMIAIPINPRSLDMIISSMISKFKKLHYFLKEIWLGFNSVAEMEEQGTLNMKKSESTLRLFQMGVKKVLKLSTLKDLDPGSPVNTIKSPEYCDIVSENKEFIKMTVLEHVDRIVELYSKELKFSVAFKPDISGLLKKFITCTSSDRVMMKTYAIIEKVSLVEKNLMLNHEFEQLVVTKQSYVFDLNRNASKVNVAESSAKLKTKAFNQKVKTTTSITDAQFAESPGYKYKQTIGESPRKIPTLQGLERAKSINMETPRTNKAATLQNTDIQKSFRGVVKAAIIADANDTAESMCIKLEEWLCSSEPDEVPIIAKDAYIHNTIKNQGNFEIILSFIFDPHYYIIGDCWTDRFPSKLDLTMDDNSFTSHGQTPTAMLDPNAGKYQKFIENKGLHLYMIRSFKATQALCDIRNLKYITQTNPRAVETYFSYLYVCLTSRDDSSCNYNHIAKLTEYLVRKEGEVCINYLLYYNILYKFLQNIEFPYVQHFFLSIFNCAYDSVKINEDTVTKVIKYCSIVEFFNDLAKIMLLGSKTLDHKKSEIEYKPLGIEALINHSIKTSDLEGMFEEKNLTQRSNLNNSSILQDELNMEGLDIDGIQGAVLNGKPKTNYKKLLTLNDFVRKPSKEVMKRYPSLREKYNIVEEKQYVQPKRSEDLLEESSSKNELSSIDEVDLRKRIPETTSSKASQKIAIHLGNSKTNVIIQTKKSMTPTAFGIVSPKDFNPFGSNTTSQAVSNMTSPDVKGKLTRPGTRQNEFGSRTKTAERIKRDITTANSEMNRTDAFRSMKAGRPPTDRSKVGESTSFAQIRDPDQSDISNQNSAFKSHLDKKALPNLVLAERITLAKEFINDAMSNEEAQLLNSLYPISAMERGESLIDKEAKQADFTIGNIRNNENFAIPICSLFESIFRKALTSSRADAFEEETRERVMIKEDPGKRLRYEMNKKIGRIDVNYAGLWTAIFAEEGAVFTKLMKNYLLKIKIYPLEESNSGFTAGQSVNLILKYSNTHVDLKKFSKTINTTCRNHARFLAKVIIQSHVWTHKRDQKVYLQDHEVADPIGPGRLLLTETLYLMIRNDKENKYSILSEINDTCWHTLVIWFFTKKTNNMYHNLFYSILELTLLNSSEKLVLNLLMKLEIVANLSKAYNEIYQNNVYVRGKHSESIIYSIKRIVFLIDTVLYTHEKWETLKNHLASSISWNQLRTKFHVPNHEKKKGSVIARGSRRATNLLTTLSNSSSPAPKGYRDSIRDSVVRGRINSKDIIHDSARSDATLNL